MSKMAQAVEMRTISSDIAKAAVNFARREMRRQLASGRVNPEARKAVVDQGGSHPTQIDTMTDQYVERLLHERIPEATYLSEERTTNLTPEAGDIVAWADPLDGTTNAFTMLRGFASVVFFEVYNGMGFDHMAGAIASEDGSVVSWQQYQNHGEVWVEWAQDLVWSSESPQWVTPLATKSQLAAPTSIQVGLDGGLAVPNIGKPERIAAVATTVSRRKALEAAFAIFAGDDHADERADLIWNVAGNPTITPLLLGELGLVVEPKSVKMHDAFFLVPFQLVGGRVYDLDYQLELHPITEFSADSPFDRRIGPFVAALADTAFDALDKKRKDRS